MLRFSVDLGIPIVSMSQIIENVVEHAGKSEEYNHKFFLKVKDMVNAWDEEAIIREKVCLKLLRLTAATQDGFILTDYPNNVAQAELLEEYKGGINSFVHLSLPDEILVDIEESKCKCADCSRQYYKNDIISSEHGVRIEKFMPENNTCDDCGGSSFEVGSDPAEFERQLGFYK